jgi:hypothetical protein
MTDIQGNQSKRTENVEEIQELVHENHHQTIHEHAGNLSMRLIAAKFVPQTLTNDQSLDR